MFRFERNSEKEIKQLATEIYWSLIWFQNN